MTCREGKTWSDGFKPTHLHKKILTVLLSFYAKLDVIVVLYPL